MIFIAVSIIFLQNLISSTSSTTTSTSSTSTTSCPPLKVVAEAGSDTGEYWLAEHGSDQAKEECGNGCLYRNIMGEEYCFKNGPGVVENFVYTHDDL